jgi:hypothetical protein
MFDQVMSGDGTIILDQTRTVWSAGVPCVPVSSGDNSPAAHTYCFLTRAGQQTDTLLTCTRDSRTNEPPTYRGVSILFSRNVPPLTVRRRQHRLNRTLDGWRKSNEPDLISPTDPTDQSRQAPVAQPTNLHACMHICVHVMQPSMNHLICRRIPHARMHARGRQVCQRIEAHRRRTPHARTYVHPTLQATPAVEIE